MRRQRFVSKELARILLSAAMVFTPIVVGMTMQVDSYAAEESTDDETKEVAMEASQENASEDASEAATEPAPETTAEPAPDAEQATAPESEPEAAPATGEYIEANYGKINTNYSTVGANDGTILNNNGLVFTNNAEIVNNDKNGVVGENNSRVISNNGVVGENKHDVIDNNNTVNNNRDRIINNNYYVELNDTDATVINNAGRVLCNAGYVGNNTDIIENNDKAVDNNSALIIANNGSVGENSGNIVENYSEATIVEEGAVQNNYTGGVVYGSTLDPDDARISNAVVANNRGGTVISGVKSEDDLTIRNYYYGDLKNTVDTPDGEITCDGTIHITNKYGEKGDTDKDFVTVENRYNSVEVYDADNTDVTYDNFVRDDVDYTQYIQTAKNGEPVEIAGTITLKAKDGYSLSDNGQLSGETDKIAYTLSKNEDGSYTVNISSLTGDVALSPEMLNLIVSEISEDHGEVTDVVVDNGDTVSVPDVENNGRGLVYSVNDGPRVYIPIEEKTRAPRGGSNAHSYKVLELGFGSITDLSVPVVKTLCEDGTLAKRCYFTYEGKLYALDIPVVDTSSLEYIEAIDALSKEKGKAAGFMRVAEIFEKVGFTVTEVAQ